MKFLTIAPSDFLKSYVKQYCFMESEVSESDITERVIPMDGVQLMFHYRNPFIVRQPSNKTTLQPRSIICGISNSFSDVSTNGESGVIFIQFFPAGACYFFDFPLTYIEDKSIDLSDVLGKDISHIEEKLFCERTIAGKVRIIESFLISRFSPIHIADGHLIDNGVRIIRQSKGQISSSLLANRLACTTKNLERKFSSYLGKTPKQFIKIIRSQEALKNLSIYKDISLTNQAYLNGYYDQSHFIKDFREFTGYSPKEFIAMYPDTNNC